MLKRPLTLQNIFTRKLYGWLANHGTQISPSQKGSPVKNKPIFMIGMVIQVVKEVIYFHLTSF